MDKLPIELIIKICHYLKPDFLITSNVFTNIINAYPQIITRHPRVLNINHIKDSILTCHCVETNATNALLKLISPEATCNSCHCNPDLYKKLFKKDLIATTYEINIPQVDENKKKMQIALAGDILRKITLEYESGSIDSINIRFESCSINYPVSFYRVTDKLIVTSDLYLPLVGSGFTSTYIHYTGNPVGLKVKLLYNLLGSKMRSKIGCKYQFQLIDENTIVCKWVTYAFKSCESLQSHICNLPLTFENINC